MGLKFAHNDSRRQRGLDIREGGCVSVITTFVGTVFPALFSDGEKWYHWLVNSTQIFISIFIYWATRLFIIGWGNEVRRYDDGDLPMIKNVGTSIAVDFRIRIATCFACHPSRGPVIRTSLSTCLPTLPWPQVCLAPSYPFSSSSSHRSRTAASMRSTLLPVVRAGASSTFAPWLRPAQHYYDVGLIYKHPPRLE